MKYILGPIIIAVGAIIAAILPIVLRDCGYREPHPSVELPPPSPLNVEGIITIPQDNGLVPRAFDARGTIVGLPSAKRVHSP